MKSQTQRTAPVRLTAAQRKVVGEMFPEHVARLKLDQPNERVIRFAADELKAIQQRAHRTYRQTETGAKRTSLRHLAHVTAEAIQTSQGIGAIPATERLYQFKITLKEVQPPIWRRIQVRDCILDKLHEHIQTAMGWTNSHLHVFKIEGQRYGDPLLLDDGFDDFDCVDSTVTKISEVVPQSGERFSFDYEYDFGDSWGHEVLFEGCLPATKGQRYPQCLEGERACPPEDVGGVWGYQEYLEAMSDSDHEEHAEMMTWRGPFDSEAFDAKKATRAMRRGVPDWRVY